MTLSPLYAPARRRRPRRLTVDRLDDRITPTCGCQLPPSQISGLVYVDQNANGLAEDTEPRLAGVTVTLMGKTEHGERVTLNAATDAGGIYVFQGLEAGTYAIRVDTPAGYLPGESSIVNGAFGGSTHRNLINQINIPGGQGSGGYNFGELVRPSPGDTPRGGNGNHYGWDKGQGNGDRPKGNNGVGNGLDPQPPGDPPVNDGPGTSPGSPGASTRSRR
jgi:hypothetical protein